MNFLELLGIIFVIFIYSSLWYISLKIRNSLRMSVKIIAWIGIGLLTLVFLRFGVRILDFLLFPHS